MRAFAACEAFTVSRVAAAARVVALDGPKSAAALRVAEALSADARKIQHVRVQRAKLTRISVYDAR